MTDYAALTSAELACALVHAVHTHDDAETLYLQNEVCHRLRIDVDETEQGLTEKAERLIDEFCIAQGFTTYREDTA